jgi:hypothetical protein
VYEPVGDKDTSMAPLDVVHEVSGVVLPVMVIVGLMFGTVTLAVAVQPLDDDVTVTLYVPEGIFDRSSDVLPFDHMKV